jgi:hypothetical protein
VTNPLTAVLAALVDARVEFVVCGGVGCILQGVARATHDLDICVSYEQENVQRLLDVARRCGLRPRIPEPPEALLDPARRRHWVEAMEAVVYTFVADQGVLSLDVFLRYPIPIDVLHEGSELFVVEGRAVRVSSRQHLIDAKRAVQPPRKTDLRDIEDLEELIRDG